MMTPLSYYKRSLAIPFLDDINSQLEYHLKDRYRMYIFAILPSKIFERDYKLEITVKILLEKYHNEMTNEKAYFRSKLKRWYDFWERKVNNVNEEIQGASKTRKRVNEPGFILEDPPDGIIEALSFSDT